MEWLIHNQEYGDDLRRHWHISSRVRYQTLLKTKGSVHDYYKQYPALAYKSGYLLIEIDFCRLYKIIETDIYKKWPIFFDDVFALATVNQKKSIEGISQDLQNCSSNCKCKMFISLQFIILKRYLNLYYSSDHKIFLQIWILPYLIPPKTRKIVQRPEGKRQWKPTIKECQSSIIIHATVSDHFINVCVFVYICMCVHNEKFSVEIFNIRIYVEANK